MSDIVDTALVLPQEARAAQYKEVRAFRALSERLTRGYSRAGWAAAAVFAGTTMLSFAGWCLFPAHDTKIIYMEHDRSTGWIGPAIGVHDAPGTFGDKEARGAMSAYIWARERFTPEIDSVNWQQVRAMTSAEAWPQYDTWVNSHAAPKWRIGRSGGHSDVFNLVFGQPFVSPDGALTYDARWSYREVPTGIATEPPLKTCSSRISFRWSPDMIASETDASLNPYGMQVIAYKQPECS